MKRAFAVLVATAAAAVTAPAAVADTVGPITFEPTQFYSPGDINGQNGWSKTGPYDVAVTPGPPAAFNFGFQSLRISNAIVSGSFGDQTFSPSTVNEAGEPAADSGGFSGGVRQQRYTLSFSFGSDTPGVQQNGLSVQVAPDRGDGARSWDVRIKDTPSGLQVSALEVGAWNPGTSSYDFVEKTIASGLSTAQAHTLKITIDFVPGPTDGNPNTKGNDVVRAFVDGNLVETNTTWEQYYRFDSEQAGGGNKIPTADEALFIVRNSDGAQPALSGKGLLFDGVTIATGPSPTCVQDTEGFHETGLLSTTVHALDHLLGSATGSPLGTLVHTVNCNLVVALGL